MSRVETKREADYREGWLRAADVWEAGGPFRS